MCVVFAVTECVRALHCNFDYVLMLNEDFKVITCFSIFQRDFGFTF
jgi:hypothetical protein